MIRSPLVARIKRTSVLVSAEKRLTEDLETMKKMIDIMEKETDMLANYKPLAQRVAQDTEGDIKMESPVKENGSSDESYVHRGSIALQARLDKMLPLTEDETDESRLQRVCNSSAEALGRIFIIFSFVLVRSAAHSFRGSIPELPSFRFLLLLLLRCHCGPSRRTATEMCQTY